MLSSDTSTVPPSILCNTDNYTLLHIAALYGHSDLALMFSMQFTWMVDAATKRHQLSPLHLACQYNNEHIVDILITSGRCLYPLHSSFLFPPAPSLFLIYPFILMQPSLYLSL